MGLWVCETTLWFSPAGDDRRKYDDGRTRSFDDDDEDEDEDDSEEAPAGGERRLATGVSPMA